MPASSVPGYLQGFRFNSANYSDGAFTDLSGYGAHCVTRTGTPVFQTVSGHEGLLLDNTWHGQFQHPNSWHGTVLLVGRYIRNTTGTLTKYLVTYSSDGASGNQGRSMVIFNSNNRNVRTVGTGGTNSGEATLADSVIGVAANALDQERRTGYATRDAVTITTGQVYTTTAANGNGLSVGTLREGAILGALTGNSADTTPETQTTIHIFEAHWFRGNAILDQQAALAAFMAELSAAYS